MKRDSILVGILTASALVMGIMLALSPRSQVVNGDTVSLDNDWALVTSSPSTGIAGQVSVMDLRDGLLFVYTTNNGQVKLLNAYNLANRFGGPRLP